MLSAQQQNVWADGHRRCWTLSCLSPARPSSCNHVRTQNKQHRNVEALCSDSLAFRLRPWLCEVAGVSGGTGWAASKGSLQKCVCAGNESRPAPERAPVFARAGFGFRASASAVCIRARSWSAGHWKGRPHPLPCAPRGACRIPCDAGASTSRQLRTAESKPSPTNPTLLDVEP